MRVLTQLYFSLLNTILWITLNNYFFFLYNIIPAYTKAIKTIIVWTILEFILKSNNMLKTKNINCKIIGKVNPYIDKTNASYFLSSFIFNNFIRTVTNTPINNPITTKYTGATLIKLILKNAWTL